jgi:AhpD family alkylhydroperoxidase
MKFRNFPSFDETTAPVAARAALEQMKKKFGAIPAPVARHAGAPAVLATALGGLDTFEKSSLAPLEREVLAMTMGRRNGCQFCLSFHTRLLHAQKADTALIEGLQNGGALSDPRLEALRLFIDAVIEHHGDVPRDVWSNFREAGYTHEQALEVVLGIGVYTLTTLANRLTETSE